MSHRTLLAIASLFLALLTLAPSGRQAGAQPPPVCAPNPSPPDAGDPSVRVDAPVAGARVTSPLQVSGRARVFEATVSLALYNAGGGAIAEGFTTAAEAGPALAPFSGSLPFTVTNEMPACLWVFEHSARDGSPRNVVQVPLTLAPAAPPPGGATLLQATAERVRQTTGPDFPITRIELVRVVGDYAVTRVYPRFGATDPALVILRLESGAWQPVAGPGTAFPDVPGLPSDLLDFTNPYTGDLAQGSINLLPSGRLTYQRDGVSFQYPDGADVTSLSSGNPGDIAIAGPMQNTPPFTGPAYTITVRRLPTRPNEPLDVWAYDQVLLDTARRAAQGDLNPNPLSLTYFHTPTNDVLQVDRFAGDSTQRDFYVAPTGGGPALLISTRVYPIENNPAAPLAQIALTLLLQTLHIDGGRFGIMR